MLKGAVDAGFMQEVCSHARKRLNILFVLSTLHSSLYRYWKVWGDSACGGSTVTLRTLLHFWACLQSLRIQGALGGVFMNDEPEKLIDNLLDHAQRINLEKPEEDGLCSEVSASNRNGMLFHCSSEHCNDTREQEFAAEMV
eukprot:3469578-Amphidinium_carterae.2